MGSILSNDIPSEVTFHAIKGNFSSLFSTNRSRVDTTLYKLYADNDLRKNIFYKTNIAGINGFYADYAGNNSVAVFSGIARDEIYLILAESLIRNKRVDDGISVLNKLLKNRIKNNTFKPISETNESKASDVILEERGKELAFRAGLRWIDLKRLNLHSKRAIKLKRKIGNSIIELEPNSARYTFKIPDQVIVLSGIAQNP